jgi:hypothetical protein
MYRDNNLEMIVAGTPRGGTNFTRFALAALGYKTSHEGIYNDEVLHRPEKLPDVLLKSSAQIEVTGFAAPFVEGARREGVKIVQLIRNPVDFVNSVLHKWPNSHGSFTVPGKAPSHTRIALWWLKQHEQITRSAGSIIMLERIDQEFIHILFDLGVKLWDIDTDKIAKALDRPDREKAVSGAPRTFTWEDMPPEVQEFASGFGYGN